MILKSYHMEALMSDIIPKISISLSFEGITLPPFQDILIIGQKCPHGKTCISKSLALWHPDNYETIEINDGQIEAIIINKVILKRTSPDKIIGILRKNVFPFITNEELIKVDFKIKVLMENIEELI